MQTKEDALQKIKLLVERFDEQIESYKKADYNETQTRRDFIDPFWKALGWDMDNENGYAESYREVIHEDRVKVGGATKAPDYSFRLSGGKRLFFLEAKKPSVAIKDEIEPAYQIRRYGWSAKMPISVITDFEEFAIYDCTNKPKPTDKASNGRIKYIVYSDYIKEFDFIWNTFSKECVLKGSFDKYIQSDKNKKGTTAVDKDFLHSLDGWRIELARNIALRNKNMNEDELNFVVQNTIDRIIFLRIAEDRHAERYGDLQDAIKSGEYYKNLLHRFYVADQKYNSGLFDFQKDKISNEVTIDNKVIKNIISELYYPICPYEFSVLSVEILGSAYEQFLGKQITLTKGGRALIEEKPEVRKAGGVYYTPQYIVDYIVKNTVGKLMNNKTPKEVGEIKIIDPACGSGSFLIGAYQFLLNWHKDYYLNYELEIRNYEKKRTRKTSVLTPAGELTTAEKKRILLNNIYGVDLDSNAVEVTKLSLLLKCMEGETQETIEAQSKLFHDRILPSLDNNIKSGNSLIDLDYYDSQLDFGEERKIKPFSWEKAFPEVFDRYVPKDKKIEFKEQYQKVKKLYDDTEVLISKYVGEPEAEYLIRVSGFDCVIGNPPYGAIYIEKQKQYFASHFKTVEGRYDNFELFLEKGIKLLRKDGLLGFIIPSPFLTNLYSRKLRQYMVSNCALNEIVSFSMPVFEDPTVHTCIINITQSYKPKNKTKIKNQIDTVEKLNSDHGFEIIQDEITNNSNFVIDVFVNPTAKNLINKLESKSKPLGEVCFIRQCIKTGNDEKYVVKSDTRLQDPWKLTLRGKSILRYTTTEKNTYLKYGDWLARNWKNRSFYETDKIAIRETGKRITATLDLENRYFLSSLYAIYFKDQMRNNEIDLKFLLGILNSELANYYVNLIALNLTEGAFAKIRTNQLARLPLVEINSTVDEDLKNKIVKNVDLLLQFNQELQTAILPDQIEQIQLRIAYCEDKINEIVYELYGLTKEEVKAIDQHPK